MGEVKKIKIFKTDENIICIFQLSCDIMFVMLMVIKHHVLSLVLLGLGIRLVSLT